MTISQKIQLRMSEVRQRLNVLAGLEGEAFTEEKRSEAETLSSEYADLETRFRAALIAETDSIQVIDKDDAEGREVRSLIGKASLAEYLREVVTQNEAGKGSPEAELRAAILGETAQPGWMPWAILAPEVLETRADAATTVGASVSIPNTQKAIMGRVFSQSATAFIGVSMPSVPVGTTAYPVMTGGTTASMKQAGAGVDAVAATFTADAVKPTRLTARYLFRVEDLALLQGMEPSLRTDLNAAMSDAMDQQVLNGNGTAPNVSGLLKDLTAPSNPSDTVTWVSAVGSVTKAVDGKFASTSNQIKLLTAPDLYGQLGVTLHSTAAGVGTAGRYMEEISGGMRVSGNLSNAPSSGNNANISTALLVKTGHFGAVAPVWQGLNIIRDPYTSAASGEVSLTAVALWTFKVIRSDVFALKKYKLA